jgi:hypothetical protein
MWSLPIGQIPPSLSLFRPITASPPAHSQFRDLHVYFNTSTSMLTRNVSETINIILSSIFGKAKPCNTLFCIWKGLNLHYCDVLCREREVLLLSVMNGYPDAVVAYFTVSYPLLKISNVDFNAPDNGRVGRNVMQ